MTQNNTKFRDLVILVSFEIVIVAVSLFFTVN